MRIASTPIDDTEIHEHKNMFTKKCHKINTKLIVGRGREINK
jgi:hypothetical protein